MFSLIFLEMDGRLRFKSKDFNELVFVIGITSRRDCIDPAVLRPGRIDLHLQLMLPNKEVMLYWVYVQIYTTGSFQTRVDMIAGMFSSIPNDLTPLDIELLANATERKTGRHTKESFCGVFLIEGFFRCVHCEQRPRMRFGDT